MPGLPGSPGTAGVPGVPGSSGVPGVPGVPSVQPEAPISTPPGVAPQAAAMSAGSPALIHIPTPAQGGSVEPAATAASSGKTARPVSRETTSRSGQQMGSAYDRAADAERAAGEAGAQAARDEAAFLDGARQQLEVRAANEAQEEQQRQDFLKTQEGEYQKALNEWNKPDAKVEQGHYWANLGTGAKILSGLAVAFGSLGELANAGAGKASNPEYRNAGLQSVLGMVEKDIQQQKERIANERNRRAGNLAGKQTLFGMARARLNDEREAEAVARAGAYQMLELESKKVAATSKAATTKAGAEAAAQQLGIEKEKALASARQHAETQYLQRRQVALAERSQAFQEEYQGAQVGLEAAKLQAGRGGESAKDYVPGVGVARPGYANKVAEAKVAHDKLRNIITRIEQHAQKFGTEVPWTEARGQGDSLRGQLIAAIKEANNLGALDNGVMALTDLESGGHPNQFQTGKFLSSIGELKKSMGADWNIFARTNVIQPEAPSAATQAFRPVP